MFISLECCFVCGEKDGTEGKKTIFIIVVLK
jgi:hypothetical protein